MLMVVLCPTCGKLMLSAAFPFHVLFRHVVPKAKELAAAMFRYQRFVEPAAASDDDCPICLATLNTRAVRLRACGHGFHSGCIESWWERSLTCPVCKLDYAQLDPRP